MPDKPPMAMTSGGGGSIALQASAKYLRAASAIARPSPSGDRPRGDHLCADGGAHRDKQRQRGEPVIVLEPPGLGEVAVEHDVGRQRQIALVQVHEQEGEVVKHVARRDQRIEFHRVERNRPAIDQGDIAEMQVAVAAAHQPGAAAGDEQRPDLAQRGKARAGQRLAFGRAIEGLARGERRLVLPDIGGERLDPRRVLDHRGARVSRRNRAGELVRESDVDAGAVGDLVERLRLVETHHVDRPLHRLALAADGEPSVGLAGDGDNAVVERRGEGAVCLDFGLAGRLALRQRGKVEKRETHLPLDLERAVAGQEHRSDMGVDALHGQPAEGRGVADKRKHVLLRNG